MRALILVSITVVSLGLTNITLAGSDVRSPDYWRESPNRWQREQWQQSPVNNRNAPYRWNKEKWRESPGNWRNKAYRKENEKYPNPSQDWRQKAYKWDKEKWSNNPNNWRNKAYRYDKKQWEKSPLNWQNSPYRWQYGDKDGSKDFDIKMNPDVAIDAARQERAPQTVTDTDESPGETVTPPQDSQQKGPRVVEVDNGGRATRDKYSSRALPVIRVHGTTPSAATEGRETFTERSSRPKHLNGFTVYGLQP